MNKKIIPEQAIKILKSQQDRIKKKPELDKFDAYQIGQYAQRFFGDKSTQTLAGSKLHDLFDPSKYQLTNEERKGYFDEYLSSSIQVIKDIGVYNPPKTNLLFYINNFTILSGIGSLLVFAFYLGWYFQSQKIDREKASQDILIRDLGRCWEKRKSK